MTESKFSLAKNHIAYFVVGHGSESGQTLGKKLLGIAVKGDIVHARISYARAFGRLLAVFVLGLIPFVNLLNLLSPLWDRENQAWHDKLADTVVVRTRRNCSCSASSVSSRQA